MHIMKTISFANIRKLNISPQNVSSIKYLLSFIGKRKSIAAV